MISWILFIEHILLLQGQVYQEQYHRIENCKNNVPSITSTFSTQNVENLFSCVRQCQVNLACQSFAYKFETTLCIQSRLKVHQCEDLDELDDAVAYKVCLI